MVGAKGGFKIIHIARATEPHEIEFLKLFPGHPGTMSAERTIVDDLASVPLERTPLADAALERHMAGVLAYERGRGPGAASVTAPEELDSETLEQLRSLGYVNGPP